MNVELGRLFRDAWIEGVRRFFPGEPKSGYVTPWEQTPDWERESAAAVCQQVLDFLSVSGGNAARLTDEQKGRFVATCWIAQIYKHIPEPKPGYVADWVALPQWQRDTDIAIFERVCEYYEAGR